MKTQHTPGPWDTAFRGTEVWNKDFEGTAITICSNVRTKQDARLIAAAPELLEACVKAFDNLRNGESKTKYRLIECLNSLEEAIKKAKGE